MTAKVLMTTPCIKSLGRWGAQAGARETMVCIMFIPRETSSRVDFGVFSFSTASITITVVPTCGVQRSARLATSDMWKKLHRNLADLPKPEIDLLHKSFVRMDADSDGCARS